MEAILNYLPYIVIAIVFYNVGSYLRSVQMMLNISKDPDRFIEMLKKIKTLNESINESGMPEEAIPLEIEHVGTELYAYDKITGQFIGQAQTVQQIIELAAKRFPGKKFWHPEMIQDTQTT